MTTLQGSTGDQRTVASRLCNEAKYNQVETVRDLLRKHPSEVDSVDDYGMTALMWASYWGRTYVVRLLLEAGASINKKNDTGESALHRAVQGGKVDVVTTLLQMGAEINSVDNNGDTPLNSSILNGHEDVMELLLCQPKIDISIKNNNGQNALHCVILTSKDINRKFAVKMLLRKGADCNLQDNNGDTPLNSSILNGHEDVMKLLLSRPKTDISIKNNNGHNALHCVILTSKKIIWRDQIKPMPTVEMLLQKGADMNSVDNDGNTPLFYAIMFGNTEVIELLINHPEIDLSIKNKEGQNLLHCAIQNGNVDVVKMLLERGAEINSVDKYGDTPLFYAISFGNTEVIELLINHPEIDLSIKNKQGQNLLYCAIEISRRWKDDDEPKVKQIVEMLLQAGLDVNSVDDHGNTSLHLAVEEMNKDALEILISHPKIDLSIKNKEGRNALHLAVLEMKEINQKEIVQKMLQKGAAINSVDDDGNTSLHLAVKEGNKDVIKLLTNHPKIDFNVKNKKGRNVLHIVVLKMEGIDQEEVLQKMLDKVVDINSVDNDGNTSLHLAVKEGNKDAIKLLINHPKIDFSIKNKEGWNALHFAVLRTKKIYRKEVLQIMFEKVDINSKDNDGNTSLHLAVKEGNKDAIKLLINHPKIDFSIKNKEGWNALHFAVLRTKKIYRKEVLQIMFEKVDINSKDKDGDTPIHIAVYKGETEVTELLIDQPNIDLSQCNDKGFTVLSLAVLRNDLITTKLLIDKHPSIINTKDGNGLTALHLAAHNGHDQIVSFLIEKGADLKLQNNSQQTPLMMAVKACQFPAVKPLVENGADLNVLDEDGDSCLHLVIRKYSASTQADSNQTLTLAVMSFLLRNGAVVNIRNKKGMTAIDLIQDTEKRKNLETFVETCL